MNFKVLECCMIFLICLVREIVPACLQGPLSNLCNENEKDYNSTENENAETICDCDHVIFCTVLSYTQNCNSTSFQLIIDKNVNKINLTQINCYLLNLDSQMKYDNLEVLELSGRLLSVKISVETPFGIYKIICELIQFSNDLSKNFTTDWKILNVYPVDILAGTEVQLQLKMNKKINLTSIWCFIYDPDNNTEILSGKATEVDLITCSEFIPEIPGSFIISLQSGHYNSEQNIRIKVSPKRPIAEGAAYNSDFSTIIINFNTNVELQSNCGNAFPLTIQKYFGVGFACNAKGNTLFVKMGENGMEIDQIIINSDNRICSEGSVQFGFCFSSFPANLTISKSKVSGPNLSFYISDECDNKTQKFIIVKAISRRLLSPKFFSKIQNGKNQRKNLILWREIRQIQEKVSSRLILKVNNSDIIPFVENLSAFENDLNLDERDSGSGESVSVRVESTFSGSSLFAEVFVTFCNDPNRLFRYKWTVNGRNISQSGKLIKLWNLTPGKYLIKCFLLSYNSTEILGQGWSTGEVTERKEEIFIIPSELITGTESNIFLRAVTSHESKVTWSCMTIDKKPCFTSDGEILNKIFNLSSGNIFLPSGTLPLGDYVWTVETFGGSNIAKVFIKPGHVTIDINVPSVFFNPFKNIFLDCTLIKLNGNCHAHWSSLRGKGFTFINLSSIGVKEISLEESDRKKFPLKIPSHTLDSDSLYLFKLQVFCPQSNSLTYIKIPLRTVSPPLLSPITVEPSTGEAMNTEFHVTGAEETLSIEDFPLEFHWSYIDTCDEEVPLGNGFSHKNFTTYLPPGDIKIMGKVCKIKNICSTVISSKIIVFHSSNFNKENFQKTINKMEFLMSTGDDSESLGLAKTMFKSLAMTAEFEIREKLIKGLEKVIDLRIKDLTEKLPSDTNALKMSKEFVKRAKTVTKYLRKGSAILFRLTNFKKTIQRYKNSN